MSEASFGGSEPQRGNPHPRSDARGGYGRADENRTHRESGDGVAHPHPQQRPSAPSRPHRSSAPHVHRHPAAAANPRAQQHPMPNPVIAANIIHQQQRAPQRFPIVPTVIAVAVIAVVLVGVGFLSGSGARSTGKVDAGVSYLKQLEGQDTTDLASQISAVQRQQGLQDMESGKSNAIWGMFDDAIIMGDSRAVGFSYSGFLNDNQVLAAAGETLLSVQDYDDQLKAANPKQIYFCYGLNDMGLRWWSNVDEYTQYLGETVARAKEDAPNATVYVNSILPVQDPAYEKDEIWRQVPEWNAAIKAYCEANDIPYVDNNQIAADHADFWIADGIHVVPSFYPYWAENMIEVEQQHEQS